MRAKESAEEIGLKIVAHVRRDDFLQRRWLVDRGAVDQYIQASEAVLRAVDEIADSRFLGKVGLERHRLDSAAAQVFDRFGRFLG